MQLGTGLVDAVMCPALICGHVDDDRQMVILERANWLAWLDLTRPEAELLRPLPAGKYYRELAHWFRGYRGQLPASVYPKGSWISPGATTLQPIISAASLLTHDRGAARLDVLGHSRFVGSFDAAAMLRH